MAIGRRRLIADTPTETVVPAAETYVAPATTEYVVDTPQEPVEGAPEPHPVKYLADLGYTAQDDVYVSPATLAALNGEQVDFGSDVMNAEREQREANELLEAQIAAAQEAATTA